MRLFLHFLSAGKVVEKDVALALMRRCFYVLCVLGMSLRKRRHMNVHMTLFKRFSAGGNIMENDVTLTSI